uniref:C-type lectin domain-containing protein n=1 Tax=Paramormyrops kingsleyae TaxID=1676925 RepID=A0A3B3SBG3_9TELE
MFYFSLSSGNSTKSQPEMLITQKDVFQNNYEALINKSQHLRLFCDTTDMRNIAVIPHFFHCYGIFLLTIILTKSSIFAEKPCRPCPQGWEPFNSSCYFISQSWKSWKDSRIECQKWGADLVIIESKEEQEFINGKKDDYWIGLKYNTKKNDWIWLDGRSLRGSGFIQTQYVDSFTEKETTFRVTLGHSWFIPGLLKSRSSRSEHF